MSRKRPPADHKLVAGPYLPPRVRRGDVLFCKRFGEVLVTGFTDRLRWPCTTRYGQPTPIVTDELARAIRLESVTALCRWWGVSRRIAHKWRRLFGVGRMTPGTFRLRQRQTFSDAERRKSAEARGMPASRKKSSEILKARWSRDKRLGSRRLWTARELALLGTGLDAVVARRIDRTEVAVRGRRRELRIRLRPH